MSVAGRSRRLGRRLASATIGSVAMVCAAATGAGAYLSASGSAVGRARVGTIGAPATVTASASAPNVNVTWSTVTPPATGTVSYTVQRISGANSSPACGGASFTTTSCTDSGVAAGTYTYKVTAAWHTWTAQSGSSNAATLAFGPATQIVLSGSTANLGTGTTRTFTATIEDAQGHTVTSGADSTDTITFSQSAGTGSVSGLTAAAASAGVLNETVTGANRGSVTIQAAGTLNGSARTSNALTFTVVSAPTLTGVSPNRLGQGVSSHNVTLTGTGFLAGAVASFPNNSGIIVNSTTVASSTSVTVNITVAANAPTGATDVKITNSDSGTATLVNGFTVGAAPTITSPTSSNPRTVAAPSPATFTITGTNFVSGATVTVSGGFAVQNTTFVDSGDITVTVKANKNAQGTYDLTVTNPDFGSAISASSMVNS